MDNISAYDLDPLTRTKLDMSSNNESIQTILPSLNLAMFWTITLLVMAYRQCLNSSIVKAVSVVLAPYLLIFGVWRISHSAKRKYDTISPSFYTLQC